MAVKAFRMAKDGNTGVLGNASAAALGTAGREQQSAAENFSRQKFSLMFPSLR